VRAFYATGLTPAGLIGWRPVRLDAVGHSNTVNRERSLASLSGDRGKDRCGSRGPLE